MNYIEAIREKPDMVSPGISACQGCGGELVLRRVLQFAGENTIVCVPPGCMAGSGVVGWNYDSGMKIPVHIPLLDNTASFLTGLSHIYQRKGRGDVNIVAIAGDGATADCGFQSLSGAAERGEHMLYVCYDNEGYMNTGYQRSSTTTEGSRTSTTPIGSQLSGKQQPQKYLPLIMGMHGVAYCATATPGNMRDMTEKIEKGLAASKRGFAYLHVFSPCPTGWGFAPEQTIQVSKKAVQSNMFPLWEKTEQGFTLSYDNKAPIGVREFVQGIGKFRNLSEEQLSSIQKTVDERYESICSLCGKGTDDEKGGKTCL